MSIIEKNAVNKSFSHASETYDFWAEPQRKAAQRIVELVPKCHNYESILDLGCGTGNVIEEFLKYYSTANILGIDIADGMVEHCNKRWENSKKINFNKGDISSYKSDKKFDLIISNCVFQWIDDFYSVTQSLVKSLKNNGCISIAVPVEGSFFELEEAYSSLLGHNMPGLTYKPKEYYTDLVLKSGLNLHTSKVETVYGYFYGVNVLKYFKEIGATFQYNSNYSPLSVKEIHQLIKYYENRFRDSDGLLPVTHKILYLVMS